MTPAVNPDETKIQELIAQSEMRAAKWIKDLETGDFYYWPDNGAFHSMMAYILQIDKYEKGITPKLIAH